MSHDLDRFVTAQAGGVYEAALAELRRGRKTSHWMWFVFPQIRGLGHSPTAQHYAIAGVAEAGAYLDHPVLGARLRESSQAVLDSGVLDPNALLGGIDALKLRSSMTLFEAALQGDPQRDETALFGQVLDALYGGERDGRTLELL